MSTTTDDATGTGGDEANIQTSPPAPEIIYRHNGATRLTHWVNALAIVVLLMSGLQIFNAHPRLYWGQYGANADHAFLEIGARGTTDAPRGFASIGGYTIDTTGILGVSATEGQAVVEAFPGWATIPSWRDLATGRRWHLFFAWLFVLNGLGYLTAGFVSGHFRRDLAPTRAELKPRHILRDIWEHARLRFPKGEAAKHYNVLQKLAYLSVVFIALPLIVLTGLTMSPAFDAIAPWLLDFFGGRQSARSIHFLMAAFTVAFIIIHVVMVVLAGAGNEIRSMVTGRYVVPPEKLP